MDAVPNLHPTFQNNALVSICCFAANTLFFAHDSVSAGQCKLPRKCNLVVDCRITIRYAKSKVTVMKQCRWRKTVAKLTRIQNEPLYDIGLNRDMQERTTAALKQKRRSHTVRRSACASCAETKTAPPFSAAGSIDGPALHRDGHKHTDEFHFPSPIPARRGCLGAARRVPSGLSAQTAAAA